MNARIDFIASMSKVYAKLCAINVSIIYKSKDSRWKEKNKCFHFLAKNIFPFSLLLPLTCLAISNGRLPYKVSAHGTNFTDKMNGV